MNQDHMINTAQQVMANSPLMPVTNILLYVLLAFAIGSLCSVLVYRVIGYVEYVAHATNVDGRDFASIGDFFRSPV